ncbi:MAG: hypothetical protein GXY48_09930 [Methanomicrobiales archaeon]|nr:hypothetical protein [Methanomicrobiales archaeon]
MSEVSGKRLPVSGGFVHCLPGKPEEVQKCRFCVHSVRFITRTKDLPSPARAFCTMVRGTEDVDIKDVIEVVCDDVKQEGYRSILNVIS